MTVKKVSRESKLPECSQQACTLKETCKRHTVDLKYSDGSSKALLAPSTFPDLIGEDGKTTTVKICGFFIEKGSV